MARKTLSRPVLITVTAVVVVGTLAAALWPRATSVDMGDVAREAMMVTIDEEGRTRVRDAYVLSTPVSGRLLRIEALPGDPVTQDETIVARMRPSNPDALDIRTRGQAVAAVEAAEAALAVAEANLEAAEADAELARTDLERTQKLAESGTVSQSALERAESTYNAAEARRRTAEAAIAQRRAELHSAQARLIGFDDQGLVKALDEQLGEVLEIAAPISGVILQVLQLDETTLPAGAPILEIGDIGEGLEVVADLISSDAVQVRPGEKVLIEAWGGPGTIEGEVIRVEPYGQTKVSALGVEEQRVTVVVRLTTPPAEREGLGHGFRVEARIVVWEEPDALTVPSSALFREGTDWAVFAVRDGRAALQPVGIGRDNGLVAQVTEGLAEGDRVVLYPPPGLADGDRVAQREVE